MFINPPTLRQYGLIKRVNNISITIPSGNTTGTTSVPTIFDNNFYSVHWLGERSASSPQQFNTCSTYVEVASTVSVTAKVQTASIGDIVVTAQRIDWDERYVKSTQRGFVIVSGAISGPQTASATLSPAVSVANSIVLFGGNWEDQVDRIYSKRGTTFNLLNSTTLNATREDGVGSTLAYYTVVEFYPGVIQSIQEVEATVGTGATTNTGTCTAVGNINNTLCLWYGSRSDTSSTNDQVQTYITYAGGTSFTINRSTALVGINSTARIAIVEFKPAFVARARQAFTIGNPGATSTNQTITQVDLDRTIISYLGEISAQNEIGMGPGHCTVELTSSTNIQTNRATLGTSSLSTTVSCNVLGFL